MPTNRLYASTSVVNGKIYAIGGLPCSGCSPVNTNEEYDPSNDLTTLINYFRLDNCYVVPDSSICFSAKMNDTTGITLQVMIESPDQTCVDTLQLFDDGNHNDGIAGDSLYANVWTVSTAEERPYFVDLKVTRMDADTVFQHLNNMASFTTIGPITCADPTLVNYLSNDDTLPNPGEKFWLGLTLKNESSVATATNIKAELISLDTLVSIQTLSQAYDEIAAGENSTTKRWWVINISEECPTNTEIPILVNISSYDHICWSDTLNIIVLPLTPDNIKDIKEPITRIYPIPTNDILNIEINNTGNQGLEIEILDITGKVIYQNKYKIVNAHFTEQIYLSGYAKGIYMVKVKNANGAYVCRVVVK
jgi:hypothetical protein